MERPFGGGDSHGLTPMGQGKATIAPLYMHVWYSRVESSDVLYT